MNCLCA
jgi:hypothetical protein